MVVSRFSLCLCLVLEVLLQNHLSVAVTVSYDHRALKLDGQRRMLVSGSIHYPRSTPLMWPGLIAKAKEGGLDVIQTYVFWNGHEPTRGVYNYAGRYNLPKFIRLVYEAGMYVNLRIGPYVCAEWNSGGFPAWLRFIPGIEFRTDNEPFKNETQRFVNHLVRKLKREKLFAWQGGPIIMAQIENEYGNIDASYGEAGQRYLNWIANMAVATNTSVPWIMCQQPEAPQLVINTCNGFYCDGWRPNSEDKPAFWTENWTGWFQSWGGGAPTRPVQDIAFSVARFFEKGGSFMNYYMYHGGTNFERTGVESVTTSYDYDAPIDEYGDVRQPKWGHLKDLHAALKLCEPALVEVDTVPTGISLGPNQEAHVYQSSSGTCAAFLASWDTNDSLVTFQGQPYDLPAWSVSILPDCKSVVFNTAKVGAQSVIMTMQGAVPVTNWVSYHEPLGPWGSVFSTNGLLEQIATTKDTTDYLWYMTNVQVAESDVRNISAQATLVMSSLRDAAHTFVNGFYTGTVNANGYEARQPISLRPGSNNITVLSMTMGLQGYGPFLENEKAGIQYGVRIEDLPSGTIELGGSTWTYQVGLQGESKQLFEVNGSLTAEWNTISEVSDQNFLFWIKTRFDMPAGNGSIALDLSSMGKGVVWVNGVNLGRYWSSFTAQRDGCDASCDYRGSYTQSKCLTKCNQPSQNWYHIPRQWLLPKNNFIVLFEEKGGNPKDISIATRMPQQICSHISQSHPFPFSLTSWTKRDNLTSTLLRAPLTLECAEGQQISRICFASYGTPSGDCEGFVLSSCHANTSYDVLTKACVGRQKCSVPIVSSIFGDDPCPGLSKSLAATAECS
ncbi:beta-galactosidase 9 [Physcomitrium patens]|uniref:Beta-galactosidase n=1 Tax=Physcomitrium patens TaxID=3218 RepID=A0A2K1K2M1_PHYPA|nr:beta-galactosidase 9-like [Physcomitrium patens]PNR48031.1 hypothetical protein PHYPA_012504 [Physcomitrium patens]|eukprot:XP_024385672.1 beta-galactosidase 9-like [Physcomitrella patens]